MAENSSQIKKEISDSGKANDIELNDIKQDQNQSAEKKDGCTSREKDLQNLVEDVRDYAATRKFNKAVYLMHGRHYFESESETSSSLEERDEFLTEKPVEGDGTWQEFHEKDANGVDFFDYEGEASDDEQREGEISDEQPLEGEISDEEQQRVGEIFYNYEGPGFEHQNEEDEIPDEHRGPGFEREDIEQRQTNCLSCRRITIIVLLISMICAAAVVIFFVTKRDNDDPNNLNKFIKEDKTSNIQNIDSKKKDKDTNIQKMKNLESSTPNEVEDEKNGKTSEIQHEIKGNGENKNIHSEDQRNAQKSPRKSVRNLKQKNTKSNKLISAAKTGLGVGLVAGLGTLAKQVYKSVTKSSKKHKNDKSTNQNGKIPSTLEFHDGKYKGDVKEVAEGKYIPHGSGVYTYNVPEKSEVLKKWPELYEGEFENGKRCGRGTMIETCKDFDGDDEKSQYTGEWKEDRRDGYGSWVRQKCGTTYKGYWKDDEYDGRGVLDVKSDNHKIPIFNGEWIHGTEHGHFVRTKANGEKFDVDVKRDNDGYPVRNRCENEKPGAYFEKRECPERPNSYTAASYMTQMDPLIHKPHFKGRMQPKRTAYKKSVPQPLSELSAFKKHIVQQKANIK